MSELHAAVSAKHPGWVQTRVARGDDTEALDEHGRTPLLSNCSRGSGDEAVQIARILLSAGANPNAVGLAADGSCLHLAAEAWNEELVHLLIEYGANPNLIADDVSPLMCAIRARQVQIAEFLLSKGADPTYVYAGRTAADYAIYEGFTRFASKLRKACAPSVRNDA